MNDALDRLSTSHACREIECVAAGGKTFTRRATIFTHVYLVW